MVITKTTRETAIVNREVQYRISSERWKDLLDSGLTEHYALEEAIEQDLVTLTSASVELVESVLVHDTDVSHE